MLIRNTIEFPTGAPSVDLVATRLESRTGLKIRRTVDAEHNVALSGDGFSQPCDLKFSANAVTVYLSTRVTYLDWCLLATLIDLGGQYKGKLPRWVNTKWADRKWWQMLPH